MPPIPKKNWRNCISPLELDEDSFIRYGNEMLDGVTAFWDGLDEQRQEMAAVD